MWKPWKINNDYHIPDKPEKIKDQLAMLWDVMYNHLPHHLHAQDARIIWQDRKINFILVLLAILVACFGRMALS